MKQIILLLILFAIGLISCEEVVDNPGLPYKKQLVISAYLKEGDSISGILITKTLPPLEEATLENSVIKNAAGYIKCDGIQYPLKFDSFENKYYVENLIPVIGKIYYLDITSDDMHVTATTAIRPKIEIDSFYIKSEYVAEQNYSSWHSYIYAVFKPNPSSVYRGYIDGFGYSDLYINKSEDVDSKGNILVAIYELWTENQPYPNDFPQSGYSAVINIFDKPYYDYFITIYQGSSSDEIFGSSGVNIRGNIDGGIGIFIGVTSSEKMIEIK